MSKKQSTMSQRTRQAQKLTTARIAVFVDGIPVINIGEIHPAPLAHYLAVADHQLNVEKRPTFHFPDMSPRMARSILSFIQTTSTSMLSEASASFPVPGRLLVDVDVYLCLLQVGMHSTIPFSTAVEICANFATTWRELTPGGIIELDELFNSCERLL